jgi:hypothetical protein
MTVPAVISEAGSTRLLRRQPRSEFPIQYAAELLPPYTCAQRPIPVRVQVRWPDGRSSHGLGTAARWNASAAYCKFTLPVEDRPRGFSLRQVTTLDPDLRRGAIASTLSSAVSAIQSSEV